MQDVRKLLTISKTMAVLVVVTIVGIASVISTPSVTRAAELPGISLSGVDLMKDGYFGTMGTTGPETSHNPGNGDWKTDWDDPGPTGTGYGRWGCNTDPNSPESCGFGDNNYRGAYKLNAGALDDLCSAAKISSIKVSLNVKDANKNVADTDAVWSYISLDNGDSTAATTDIADGEPVVSNNFISRGYGKNPPHTTLVTTADTTDNGTIAYTVGSLDISKADLQSKLVVYVWHEQSGGGSNYNLLSTVTTTAPKIDITYDDSACPKTSDLSLTKTIVSGASTTVGGEVEFEITVSNGGPDDATGVEVTDRLSSGLEFVSGSPSVGTYDGSTGVWNLGSLANGASATMRIKAKVTSFSEALNNVAEITGSDNADPDSAVDNCDSGKKLEDDCGKVSITEKKIVAPKTGAVVGATIASAALVGMLVLGAREYINKRALKAGSEK